MTVAISLFLQDLLFCPEFTVASGRKTGPVGSIVQLYLFYELKNHLKNYNDFWVIAHKRSLKWFNFIVLNRVVGDRISKVSQNENWDKKFNS